MSQPMAPASAIDHPVEITVTSPEAPPDKLPLRLAAAADFDALARLAAADDTDVVARMLLEWPAPIHAHHFYGHDSVAGAMARAIAMLRPAAVYPIRHQRTITVSEPGARVGPSLLWLDIPMRTRLISLVAPFDLVTGWNGEGEWRYHAAIADAIFGDER